MDKYNESMTKKVWFEKVQTFIDHIHVIGLGMIWVLGIWLSIDEMMARFMGRSIKTYRMKNKPISEEYIFFTTSTGYVISFTPDERTAAGRNKQECNKKKVGKVKSLIHHIITVIKNIQREQDTRHVSQRSRCHTPDDDFYHKILQQSKFCIAMDIFHCTWCFMPMLREKRIDFFETLRFQKHGWPTANIREPTKEKCNFNDF